MIDLPPPPNYEQTIEAIEQCDIPRANIKIAYEDYLQSDEITITDIGEITDAKLRCLKGAVHPFYILSLLDESQRSAFYAFAEREDRPKSKAEAREWLRVNGLLDRLPAYDPSRGLVKFAAEVERACDLDEGSALIPHGASFLTIQPKFLLGADFEKTAKALQCLTRMVTASDADQHGVRLGFIGNEAVRKNDEI